MKMWRVVFSPTFNAPCSNGTFTREYETHEEALAESARVNGADDTARAQRARRLYQGIQIERMTKAGAWARVPQSDGPSSDTTSPKASDAHRPTAQNPD